LARPTPVAMIPPETLWVFRSIFLCW